MTVGAIVQLILGIIAAAAITQAYGITSWNAWDMCELILEHNWNGHWRAGIALFCLVQCFGTIVLNSFANCIPFGCDMAGVFPKYINILRGQVFCMVVSWAICPWSILTSGVKFVIFLGSYTVFMAGLMAILLSE
jgi:NCS1 family nucleobase:cation symporter-1